ncbi:MAG: SBBP repeat-containing protein [Anaerolineae bacterium]|nr:SBBP repeat-containing protein [Anaerolineae bacterium]
MSTHRVVSVLVLIVALLAPGASLAQPVASQAAVESTTSSGSMLIIENAGQWPEAARFQVWGSPLGAGTTWLAQDAIWLVVGGGDGESGRVGDNETFSPSHPLTPSPQTALKLTFPGSNPDVRIEAFDPPATTVSYFIGNDPAQWHPAVPVWGGVRYVDLYPGVDLEISAAGARLAALPGADLDAVTLRVEGAGAATLDGDTLRLSTAAGDVLLPLLHGNGLPAAGATVQPRGLEVFEVSAPFTSRSTAPSAPDDDPTDLIYSTYLGGSPNWDQINVIAVDSTGRPVVTGLTESAVFPTTPGAFDPSFGGGTCGTPPDTYPCPDAFVARLSADGSTLEYSTYLGGGNDDQAAAIALDNAGRATVVGYSFSGDFPTTAGVLDPGGPGSFVTRLNADGSALVYSTFLHGCRSQAIAVDGAGQATLAGRAGATGCPVPPTAFDPSFNGGVTDAWVGRLNANGSTLVFSTFLGGSDDDSAAAVVVDGAGRSTVTGASQSGNFPTSAGAFDTSFAGGTCGTPPNTHPCADTFVTRLNADASALVYSTYLGGGGSDRSTAIAADGASSVYVTGETESLDFPTTPGAFDSSFNGSGLFDDDSFVTRLNAGGTALVYSTYLGGADGDIAMSIAVDSAGRATVAGTTASSDFPTTPDAFDTSKNGSGSYAFDAFVARLAADGRTLSYGSFLGGRQSDRGFAVALDSLGRAIVAGMTASSGFPTTPGAFDPYYTPGLAGFISKFDMDPYAPNVLAPIEQPTAGAFVSGVATLRGFAIDLASSSGTGIDMVHIYLDGPSGTGTLIGAATYGLDRPDIAAQYGARFGPSGWELSWDTTGLAPGVHQFYLYAHRTTDDVWSAMEPHLVIAPGGHLFWLPTVHRNQ